MLRSFYWLLSLTAILPLHATAADLRQLNFMHFQPDFDTKTIEASLIQTWQAAAGDTFSLHLQSPLKVVQWQLPADLSMQTLHEGVFVFTAMHSGRHTFTVHYGGAAVEAKNPPWDGGLIWRQSSMGLPWLTVACQDVGASVWWPAPPAYSQEADTVDFTATYPSNLFFKGNGRMVGDIVAGNQRTTHWRSTYPINLYNITVNIGDYAHFGETMQRSDGSVLNIDYYPLRENLSAAKKQFRQTRPMLLCFESAFGKYPCSNDGFSVVETPYAGMEHQGAVAYGNGYRDGYRGEDYSGIGLGFDFILIHESAHEWWGNAVTAASPADFWMQEAFCTYAEMQYVACRFSASKALAYIQAKRRLVSNRAPIYGNSESGVDMYAKGALMLHSMSLMLPQRSDFIVLLRSFIKAFTHTPVTTEALCTWFEQRIPSLKPEFFTQFLKHNEIPLLEMREAPGKPGQTEVRFTRCVAGFAMPIAWDGKGTNTVWVSTEWTLLPKNVQPNHLRSATLTSYFEFS